MEISTIKISHMRLSFETQFSLSFLSPFTSGKKCLEFPLRMVVLMEKIIV